MTELLTRHRPAPSGAASSGERPSGRPLAANAAAAALISVGAGLAGCWLVALVGWFASDGGAHGQSTSALKVGTGAWLLAHGTDLHLDTAVVTAVPLGLTLVCAWLAYRAGRWAGAGSEVEDLWSLALATVVLAGTYGIVALAAAVLTTTSRAAPDPLSAFLGATLVAALGGGAGLVLGSGLRAEFRALLPIHARAVLFGGLVGVLSLWSAGALLAAAAVALRGENVANVLARLHVDVAGGFFSILLVALLAPNLATWGSSYLLGGGFAVGADTVVAPTGVVIGPVPAVPVLAAVPESGEAPGWALGVLAVPVACGLLVGWAVTRRFPTTDYRLAVGRAAGAGLVATLVLTLLALWSGGSVGGGRMRDVGPDLTSFALMAALTLVLGAAVSAAGSLWWQRREGVAADLTDADLGLERRLPWRDQDAAERRAQQRAGGRLDRSGVLRRRRAADGVPSWARLGVWGASTPSTHAAPESSSGPSDDVDEDTTHVPRA